MNKWLLLAAAALLLLWAPFLLRELGRQEPVRNEVEPPELLLPEPKSREVAVPPPVPPEPEAADEPVPPEPADVEEELEPEEDPEPEPPPPPPPPPPPEEDQGEPSTQVDKPDAPVRIPPASGPVEVLKHAFEEETRDALWAGAQEATLRSMGSEYGFELSGDDVSCRRTVCRVGIDVNLDNTRPMLDLYVDFAQKVNKTLALQPETLGDDSTRVFLYVPRSGYELSDFSQ